MVEEDQGANGLRMGRWQGAPHLKTIAFEGAERGIAAQNLAIG